MTLCPSSLPFESSSYIFRELISVLFHQLAGALRSSRLRPCQRHRSLWRDNRIVSVTSDQFGREIKRRAPASSFLLGGYGVSSIALIVSGNCICHHLSIGSADVGSIDGLTALLELAVEDRDRDGDQDGDDRDDDRRFYKSMVLTELLKPQSQTAGAILLRCDFGIRKAPRCYSRG